MNLGATYELVVWSGAEDFVIIVCGSIPALKPFWDHYVKRQRTLAGSRSASGYQSQEDTSGPISCSRYRIQPSATLSQNFPLVSRTCDTDRILVTSDIEIQSRNNSNV